VSGARLVVQRAEAVPAGDAWLSPGERARAAGMRFAARRADFRLGRWTAKRALARWLGAADAPERLAEIDVRGAPKSPPEVFWRGAPAPCSLSLSHRAGAAVAAVSLAGVALGCDLERGEPRSAAFAAQYLTDAERDAAEALGEPLRSAAIALVWSAKESALKALGRGLDLDAREVSVRLADGAAPLAGRPDAWRPLTVALAGGPALGGFWCARGPWLLTVVAAPELPAPTFVV
jgi:4'-phosphopantetheinyl transferase